ncbi:translocase of inner mitochondrial membrane 23 isoform X2 [Oratosquilla oratoria]|uniref:translocase of inner mitochondrial membrane 23 isoform X2 n=1 Tax=Oratosquilla oratoria TaxID=337810 RepID=UPI003F7580B2
MAMDNRRSSILGLYNPTYGAGDPGMNVPCLCMIGASLGGTHGLYRGLQETSAAGHTGKIRRTQLLNYVMKRGSASANTLGVVAVMYSGLGCLLYWGRGSHEDELNTLGAGTLTGLLYKSTAGLKKCAIGGAVGLALSAACIAFSSRDKLKQQYGSSY